MVSVSVLVVTYNQSYASIFRTLNSVIKQDLDDFEIIIADDCSTENPKQAIEKYFAKTAFSNYKIIINHENVGTVQNFINGIKIAKGEFVKGIGAGDLLYASDTLSKMYQFAQENDISFAFGKLKTYSWVEGSLIIRPYAAPLNIVVYQSPQDKQEILKHLLIDNDWIPGVAQFYKREFILELFFELAERYRVRYCEDIVSPLVALSSRIDYFDDYLMWYEWGVGISNSGNSSARKRMYTDHNNFFWELKNRFGEQALVRAAYRKFKLKQFVVLKTPLTRLLSRIKSAQYHRFSDDISEKTNTDDIFLLQCLDAVE